ncbi:receptor-like serine/threonine-protein kinase SD1-8 [Wolffia australiana]
MFPLVFFFLLMARATAAARTRVLGHGETLLSPDGSFELGFFSPSSSHFTYLVIFFKKSHPPLPVWVANRSTPLLNSTALLQIDDAGQLLLSPSAGGPPVFSAGHGGGAVSLLNSGNLVLKSLSGELLWQSFEHPQRVMLPGMKLTSGDHRYLSSWASPSDPSQGRFSLKLEFNSSSSLPPRLLLFDGSSIRYSAGHFNGERFTGVPSMQPNSILRYFVETKSSEAEFWFEMEGDYWSVVELGEDGVARKLIYEEGARKFKVFTNSPADECDRFANCGAFAVCNMSNIPVCGCMAGYVAEGGRAGGCRRRMEGECSEKDGFLAMKQVKLPGLEGARIEEGEVGLEECRERCGKECSCRAFAEARVGLGGCITWHGELVDVRVLDTKVQDLFIRVPVSALENQVDRNPVSKRKLVLVALLSILLPATFLALLSFFHSRRSENIEPEDKESVLLRMALHDNDDELVFYPAQVVALATSHFASDNKIGEGGFGVVYKGILPDGQEVAVKKLTNLSMEGQHEFTNEVKSLAKLKHKNLVQLVGCCIDGKEKMLIYEYMKNKSLDAFIFDEKRRVLLGWRTRLDIVLGIARGLEYLHHDSGSRIIHRDLKAWNILLDEAMVPKISDFGTARIFNSDEMLAKTRKIIGTYGYMSPEYAIKGIISMKSDVFSFGVLTLEIISGIRNRSLFVNDFRENLLSKTWRLWKEGSFVELLDQCAPDKCPIAEVLRCIHVAMLCVQEQAEDRPTMASIAMMLSTETFPLPKPRRLGFVMLRNPKEASVSVSNDQHKYTGNGMTITEMVGR